MDKFGVEFLDDIHEMPNNYMLAAWLLYQSGRLVEFGPLEQGDHIEIVSFQVTIFGIRIVARLGSIEKVFYLKAIRCTEKEANGDETLS